MLGGGRYSQYFTDTISVVNLGTVLAEGADGMGAMGPSFDNRNGVVQVADGSRFDLNGVGTFTGGTLHSLGAASLRGGGTFEGVTLRGGFELAESRYVDATMFDTNRIRGSVASSSTVSVGGSLVNHGTLHISGGGSVSTTGALQLLTDTTLSGSGQTVLGNRADSFIGNSDNTAKTLTIASGHTLRGSGMLGGGRYSQYFTDTISVVNLGTVLAEGADGMGAIGPGLENRGRLVVSAGSRFDARSLSDGIRQTAAEAVTQVDGTLDAHTLWLDAGTLSGSGVISADVVVGQATVAPGNSPGKLSIVGDLVLGEQSVLLVEVNGPTPGVQHDWLDVSGSIALDGTLRIVFSGFAPSIGDRFTFMTTGAGAFSGTFDVLDTPGYQLSLVAAGPGMSFTVDAITAVPEPGTLALLLLGGLAVGAIVQRRRPSAA
jgi:fibronectin-binding autotransporter adhesin